MKHQIANTFTSLRERISSMERWKINLYTIWFSQILSLMSFNFGIPFIPYYITELGVKDPVQLKFYVGLLTTAPSIASAVMAPVWGMAADKWGKKLMLLRAMAAGCIVIAGMGIATNVYQIVALRIAQGIFTGTIAAATLIIASTTPTNKLSYALGFLSSSTFIGQSAGPVIGGILADYAGYRVSFLLGSLLMLIDFFIVLFLAKEVNNEEVNADMGTITESNTDKLPAAEEDNAENIISLNYDGTEKSNSKKLQFRRKPLKNSKISFIFSASMLAMLFILFVIRSTRALFNPYIPLFVQEMRSTTESASKITGMINGFTGIMTALSGMTLSRLGDKYSKTRVLTSLFIISIILSVPLALSGNLFVFTLCYGIFYYIMGGIEPITISVTTENTPVDRRGLLFGIQGFIGNMGMAIAPMIGSMISIRFSIRSILYMIPLTLIPGFLMVFIISRKSKNTTVEDI